MRLLGIATFCLAFALPVTAQHESAQQYESFYQFHSSICRDEAFRHERTAWPLEYVYPDETNGYEPALREVSVDDPNVTSFLEYAPCPHPEPGERRRVYDNFELELRDTGQRAVFVGWGETGAGVTFYYERRGGVWYLVRIRDMSM